MKRTHPTLWKWYMIYALGSIALGVNFLLLQPAFMPLDLPKGIVGVIFLGCGITKLILLLLNSHLSWLRLSMTLTVAIYSFWAGILAVDFVRLDQTSMQLPICFIMMASWAYVLLGEPFSNPATATEAVTPETNGK